MFLVAALKEPTCPITLEEQLFFFDRILIILTDLIDTDEEFISS